jgi:hypothetical protein
MKKIIVVFVGLILFGCKSKQAANQKIQESEINFVLNNWHQAAAEANFNSYFDAMANDAIFIGTDATENWTKPAFMEFAKPFFDKGKAWNFTALERHIFFSSDRKTAWFDELLNTQMKICRGSGVIVDEGNGSWKIKQYVLSMTIPNDHTNEVVKIKSDIEDVKIKNLTKK